MILERGEGREKGRVTLMWERNIHRLFPAHTQLGTEPATQACALTRNQTSDLSVWRMTRNQLSHASQSSWFSSCLGHRLDLLTWPALWLSYQRLWLPSYILHAHSLSWLTLLKKLPHCRGPHSKELRVASGQQPPARNWVPYSISLGRTESCAHPPSELGSRSCLSWTCVTGVWVSGANALITACEWLWRRRPC